MKKTRDSHIDAIKGYAIILVVLAHVAVYTNAENIKSPVLALIYSYHMPLFFFISGYLVFNQSSMTFFSFLQKKTHQLLIPYAIFTAIFFYWVFFPSYPLTIDGFINNFFSYTVYNSAWFLPVLFESLLILRFGSVFENILGNGVYLVILVFLGIMIPLTVLDQVHFLHQLSLDAPYVIIGYLASSYKSILTRYMSVIGIVGLLAFPVLFWFKFGSIYPAVNSNLFYLNFGYVLALSGIIVSWHLMKILTKSRAILIFLTFGIYSLEIYLTHLIILNVFVLHHWPLWIGTGSEAVISGSCVVLIMSLCLSLIISYNEKLSNLVFGRWSLKTLLRLQNKSYQLSE